VSPAHHRDRHPGRRHRLGGLHQIESMADRTCRPEYAEARCPQCGFDFESDEELVLDNEDVREAEGDRRSGSRSLQRYRDVRGRTFQGKGELHSATKVSSGPFDHFRTTGGTLGQPGHFVQPIGNSGKTMRRTKPRWSRARRDHACGKDFGRSELNGKAFSARSMRCLLAEPDPTGRPVIARGDFLCPQRDLEATKENV